MTNAASSVCGPGWSNGVKGDFLFLCATELREKSRVRRNCSRIHRQEIRIRGMGDKATFRA